MGLNNSTKVRREFLKAYVFSLLGEADFSSPTALISRAAQTFAIDLPIVAKELAEQLAESTLDFGTKVGAKASAVVMGKLADLVGDVSKRGVGAVAKDIGKVWKNVQATYARGAEANARRR
jgi:hypothetical protein